MEKNVEDGKNEREKSKQINEDTGFEDLRIPVFRVRIGIQFITPFHPLLDILQKNRMRLFITWS